MANEPYELIAAPAQVWLAPVGEAFPDINDAPTGNWALLGTSGDQDYGEDGVVVTHEHTLAYHHFLGSTGPRKATRTREGLRIGLMLHDSALETLSDGVFNGNAVVTTAAGGGEPGDKAIGMYQGLEVSEFALLLRGKSAYGDWNAQYEVPKVVRDGAPAPVFSKGAVAGYAIEFVAIEDPDAATAPFRFGTLRMMHAAVSP